jgi:hypothetical protein
MPWLGFFHKLARADLFVVLDNVQFRKNYYQNRNKVRTADGWAWFTVPVSRNLETLICDVVISEDARWKAKWWNTISLSYKRSPFFEEYGGRIKDVFEMRYDKLSDLNIALLTLLCGMLGIRTKFMLASQMAIKETGSDLILDICKKSGADIYLSGISGKEYLKLDDFKNEGIALEFQEFHHPIYKQLYEPFLPCMSVIDLIFNHGEKSMEIINGEGVPVMQDLFL